MPGLLDIVPVTEEVPAGGTTVTIRPVSLTEIAGLLVRFPAILKMFEGKPDAASLMASAPEAVCAAIACAAGNPGDVRAEQIVSTLSIEDQVNLIEAVFRISLPNGIGPVVDKLVAMGLLERESDVPSTPPGMVNVDALRAIVERGQNSPAQSRN